MARSNIIRVTDYALIEYIYSNDPLNLADSSFVRVENAYNDQVYLFSNNSVTKNFISNTVYQLENNNTFVRDDANFSFQYYQTDTNILFQDVSNLLAPVTVEYDTVRLHIKSGYDFDGIEGVLLLISAENSNFDESYLSSFAYEKNDEFSFNSEPIFLNDAYYDRFVEFKIPSVSWMNLNFYGTSLKNSTVAYYGTSNNSGYSTTSPLNIRFLEIDTLQNVNGFSHYRTGRTYSISIPIADQFIDVGAVLRESPEGDFFEYYATFRNDFIDEYIQNLNSTGQEWAIISTINVYEQVGLTETLTRSITEYQTTNFDRALTYRPVIQNADVAFSFTIEYVMKLFNQQNASQVLRRTSVTSLNPKKYGKKLETIKLRQELVPYQIFNKVISNVAPNVSEPTEIQDVSFVYVPTYLESLKISTAIQTLDLSEVEDQTRVIFGQGEGMFAVTPFQFFIRFTIYTLEGITLEPELLNLNYNVLFFLTFLNDRDEQITIPPETKSNLSAGELIFKITKNIAEKLLQHKNKTFFLITRNDSNEESSFYSGSYVSYTDRAILQERVSEILSQEFNKNLTNVQDIQQQIIDENATTVVNKQVDGGASEELVINVNIKNTRALVREHLNGKQRKPLRIVEIPGANYNLNIRGSRLRPNNRDNDDSIEN